MTYSALNEGSEGGRRTCGGGTVEPSRWHDDTSICRRAAIVKPSRISGVRSVGTTTPNGKFRHSTATGGHECNVPMLCGDGSAAFEVRRYRESAPILVFDAKSVRAALSTRGRDVTFFDIWAAHGASRHGLRAGEAVRPRTVAGLSRSCVATTMCFNHGPPLT